MERFARRSLPTPSARALLTPLVALLLSACSSSGPTAVGPPAPEARLAPAAAPAPTSAPGEWTAHGLDMAETRFSPLEQVDTDNVDRLEVAWSWEIPKTGARLEATPIISDGVMYATGALSFVYALDARTGEEKWRWDPAIPTVTNGGPGACCGNVNRGVALYADKVFVGLLDGRLVALNKETGTVEWTVQTLSLIHISEPTRPY